MNDSLRVQVIDSHTGGEPTRVVIAGIPELGSGPLAERRKVFAEQHDAFRQAVANEPRGHDAMVGALLVEPHAPDCVAGVIYFNNVGVLNMCIHGTIGLGVTLLHMGKIGPGSHRIDTPVGMVTLAVADDGRVTVTNVPSYRAAAGVEVDVPGWGLVKGDIAWGGNWFFLIDGYGPAVSYANLHALSRFTIDVQNALAAQGITGDDGMPIDHVESFGPPDDPALADSKNFVMCPGGAYDRSPCGTGTSAKLACLHAAGKLAPGQIWRQAGILDTAFEGRIDVNADGTVTPIITGSAWVCGESTYVFHPEDPFRFGFPSPSLSPTL